MKRTFDPLILEGQEERIEAELDKRTKESITWTTKPPPSMYTGRQAAENVMLNRPGVKPEYRNAIEPLAAWELYSIRND